jgi:hypothetical protein
VRNEILEAENEERNKEKEQKEIEFKNIMHQFQK